MTSKWAKGSGGPAGDECYNVIALPDVCPTLRAGGNETGGNRPPGMDVDTCTSLIPVAFAENSRAELRLEGGDGARTGTLSAGGGKAGQGVPMVAQEMRVRRLTPVECERLQGFPDDYTRIPWRGRTADACPDGPRYKALGNSWAVPCARWIGERIAAAVEPRGDDE